MTLTPPIRYTPTVEDIQPDEPATIDKLNATFDTILQTTAKDYGHAVRGVHAKAHAVLQGTLRIEDDLPPELAQGLFATPGEHKVYLRFSTNPGDILHDAISLPRGLALKVLDVPGERLPGAEGSAQDFLLVNGKTFLVKTPAQFLRNLKLLARTTDRLEGVKRALSRVLRGVDIALSAVGIQSSKVKALGGAPNADPLGQTYYSVTPYRFGDYIAKFSVAPVSPDLVRLAGKTIAVRGRRDAIRETLQAEMPHLRGEWELRVQLCRDLESQPIEDATVEWMESQSPFQRVAMLSVAPQESWAPERVQAVDEAMRFSAWTGIMAHQPLGSINRARKATYEHSARFRAERNRCPIHEPTGAGEIT